MTYSLARAGTAPFSRVLQLLCVASCEKKREKEEGATQHNIRQKSSSHS